MPFKLWFCVFCLYDMKNFIWAHNAASYFAFTNVLIKKKSESLFASYALKDRVATYRFYNALCAGEHCTHNGEIFGVGHPPLAHVFENFSSCWSSERVFGVKAHICIDACSENTKSSSEDKP